MAYNSVIIKSYVHIVNEYEAVAAITPGDLVEITSAGKVQKHSGAGKTAAAAFAIEDALQGKGLGVEDAYAAGDRVRVWNAIPGEEVYARLADEENVAIGDFVESNGYGQVRKVVRSAESWESANEGEGTSIFDKHVVGQVLAAVDTTSLSTDESEARSTEQYVRIRII
jgi:GNAT superfamily N-acetyltransferase